MHNFLRLKKALDVTLNFNHRGPYIYDYKGRGVYKVPTIRAHWCPSRSYKLSQYKCTVCCSTSTSESVTTKFLFPSRKESEIRLSLSEQF